MKQTILTPIFLVILLFCSNGLLWALEVELSGGNNTLTFNPNMKAAYSDPAVEEKEFLPYHYIFGNILIKNDISDDLTLNINLIRDNILQNNFEIIMGAKSDYFSFHIGSFLGLPDVLEYPFFGVLSSIELIYPGVVFLELSGSLTYGKEFDFTSNHERETAGARFGFWLPSAIPSVSASLKRFKRVDPDITTHNTLIRYQLSIDLYSKKNPITFRIDAGYQTLKCLYNNGITDDYTDELNTIFAGFELTWQVSNKNKILLGAETPVNCFPKAPMTTPVFYMMPKFTAGLICTTH